MNGYDGPALRALRESKNIALRRVARLAGLSHGHLSKVERGEAGRAVTAAVLHGYEKATGEPLSNTAGYATFDGWRPGQMSEIQLRSFNARVAAVAVGGPLAEPIHRVVDSTGRLTVPDVLDGDDIRQVEQAAQLCTAMDLHHGGAIAGQIARALLKWAHGLLTAESTDTDRLALYTAIATLAHRAAWSLFDSDSHEVARVLFTVSLYAAGRADNPDLRAHVLADLAAGHNHLGHPEACLQVVRLAEVDERVSPHVHAVVAGVKARAHGLRGDTDACHRSIQVADEAHARAEADQRHDWRDTIATAGRLSAVTGHALATLARRTGSHQARDHAIVRLTKAVEQLDPVAQRRSAALATAQLATLHAEAGDVDQGQHWAAHLDPLATGIRSARLASHLAVMRKALTNTDQHATPTSTQEHRNVE